MPPGLDRLKVVVVVPVVHEVLLAVKDAHASIGWSVERQSAFVLIVLLGPPASPKMTPRFKPFPSR